MARNRMDAVDLSELAQDRSEVLLTAARKMGEKHLQNFQSEKKRGDALRNALQLIAEKLCDSDYGNNQLGGPNQLLSLADMDLRDYILSNVSKRLQKYTQVIKQLQIMIQDIEKEKESIAEQLIEAKKEIKDLKEKVQQMQDSMMSQGISLNPTMSASQPEKNGQRPSQNTKDPVEVPENGILIDGDEVLDLRSIGARLTTYHYHCLEVIGSSGVSERQEIVARCLEHEGIEVKDSKIISFLDEMIEAGVLLREDVSTGTRTKVILLDLTAAGKAIFKKEFKKNPVKSEKTRMVEMHASLEHAWCIKDTATILQNIGYKDVCMDSSANDISLPDNTRYVPDIVATYDKLKQYFEVELGHHTQHDFNSKIRKAALASSNIFIITKNEAGSEILKKQIVNFKKDLVVSNSKMTKFTIYLGTMKQLEKRVIMKSESCRFDFG